MNDFTKEELIELSEYCDAWKSGIGLSKFRMDLWHKIESMVESYCAHEWITFLQNQNQEPYKPFIERCFKCFEIRLYNEDKRLNDTIE